jgi:hypothetical protein
MFANSKKISFNEYYKNNMGILFKKFDMIIGNRYLVYDIYWADPGIIFNGINVIEKLPLAVTIIPKVTSHPNPRIFLHEKLELKYKDVFEFVITHEIGHLWLYDIIGVHQHLTPCDVEIWADYFAYNFFIKYRNITKLEQFNNILNKTLILQGQINNIPHETFNKVFHKKMEDIRMLIEKIKIDQINENIFKLQLENTIDPTLNSLGDIFK